MHDGTRAGTCWRCVSSGGPWLRQRCDGDDLVAKAGADEQAPGRVNLISVVWRAAYIVVPIGLALQGRFGTRACPYRPSAWGASRTPVPRGGRRGVSGRPTTSGPQATPKYAARGSQCARVGGEMECHTARARGPLHFIPRQRLRWACRRKTSSSSTRLTDERRIIATATRPSAAHLRSDARLHLKEGVLDLRDTVSCGDPSAIGEADRSLVLAARQDNGQRRATARPTPPIGELTATVAPVSSVQVGPAVPRGLLLRGRR